MTKVVFDTNVLVSYLINENGTPARAVSLFYDDETDRIFYDTAKQSGSFLVTGNLKHYPQEIFILTPAEFLAKL